MRIVVTFEVPRKHEQTVAELYKDGDHIGLLEWCDNYYAEKVEVRE